MSTAYIYCPTADAEKLLLFAKSSHSWWGKNVYPNLLRTMNEMKIPLIKEILVEAKLVKQDFVDTPKPLQGLTILDVGCGGGYISEPLAELGCQVVGIDVCFDLIEVAKQHATLNPSLTNLTYSYESIEEHSKYNCEKYDAIIASEVIIHVNELDLFLEETLKCLKPGGLIYISTSNKTWACWIGGVVLGEYILGLLPRGIHSWDRHVTPDELEKKLQKCNCQTKGIRGLIYNPYSAKWAWSKYTSVYYSLYATKDVMESRNGK